ncbi:hypothetical protein M5D96_012321 [Drosophila gunungcola]|uniref:Uncharacterized protein n=1 Tax=Drosophila gunungcola TaxID=103775 RepID=A0A9P9YDP2_9MUSC|nr:hypothetical protein M5D96_012321 [Drosophila gunungcola]
MTLCCVCQPIPASEIKKAVPKPSSRYGHCSLL